MSLLWAVWLGSALAMGPPGGPGDFTDAEEEELHIQGMFNSGRFRAVASRMRERIKANPADTVAVANLGRAIASLGRCYHAMPILEEARETSGWSAPAATAEGICAARRGDHSTAIAAFEEALVMDPEYLRAWYPLALSSAAVGDVLRMEDALSELEGAYKAPHMLVLARAWLTFEHGGDLDFALYEVDASLNEDLRLPAEAELAILDAREWIRIGAPELAVDRLERGSKGRSTDARLHAWLAEAWRRAGVADQATKLWTAPLLSRSQTPEVRVLHARWAIDEGKFDEAERLLGLTEGEEAQLWLPTRWLLATARGEDTETWRDAYERERGPGDPDLSAIVRR